MADDSLNNIGYLFYYGSLTDYVCICNDGSLG